MNTNKNNRTWTTLARIFQYGVSAFTRNAWLSTAATAVMTVTLLIITTSFMMRMIFADTIDVIQKRIDVSVYLVDNITDQQREQLTSAIREVPIVTDIAYISKEEARSIFEENNRSELENLEALREVQSNPFPASLRVSTSDPSRLGEISDVAQREEFKPLQSAPPSNAGERREAIDRIASVSQTFEVASLTASIVFVVISMLIIFNTIRMAIFNRREEIQMMRLIGADPSFIRGPFIIEAALYGMAAAVIATVLVYAVILTQSGMFANYQAQEIQVADTINLFKSWPFLIVPIMILAGIVVGVSSSLLAMRRYLKDRN